MLLDGADSVEVLQSQPAAPPNLTNPLVAEFVDAGRPACAAEARSGPTSRASRRAGIPAVNFGPGDPEIAHTAGELVTRDSIEQAYATLAGFVGIA